MSKIPLAGNVVIITGASSGIGLACAEAFAIEKCKLVLAARQVDKLQEAEQKLKAKGIEILIVPTDVSKEEDCKKLVEKAIERFGKIDILINNAGITMKALFEDVSLDVMHKLMDTNFWGAVYCTKYALPYLLKSKGSVIGISSIAGKGGAPGRIGYSASKFALEGFLETLRTENLKHDLHVMVVCPGFTASNIRNTALLKDGSLQENSPRNEQKMMQPSEVARGIIKGIIKRERDLIFTFNGKLTVFLNKWFPSWVDQLVYSHMKKEADSPLKK